MQQLECIPGGASAAAADYDDDGYGGTSGVPPNPFARTPGSAPHLGQRPSPCPQGTPAFVSSTPMLAAQGRLGSKS